ncbi:hypothetical protein ACS0TY_014624 [Phlomoides rotata]
MKFLFFYLVRSLAVITRSPTALCAHKEISHCNHGSSVSSILIFSVIEGFTIKRRVSQNDRRGRFSLIDKMPAQISHMRDLVDVSDDDCKDQLRMDKVTFNRLCQLLQNFGGLKD